MENGKVVLERTSVEIACTCDRHVCVLVPDFEPTFMLYLPDAEIERIGKDRLVYESKWTANVAGVPGELDNVEITNMEPVEA